MAKISVLTRVSTEAAPASDKMFATASSPGLNPAAWAGWLEYFVLILNNGDTYMKLSRGHADTKSGLTIRTKFWPVTPILAFSEFSVDWAGEGGDSKWDYHVRTTGGWHPMGKNLHNDDVGKRYASSMSINGDSASWSYSDSADFREGQDVTADDLSSSGYMKILSLENWPIEDASVTLYTLGIVMSNMDTTVNKNNVLNSNPIVITADAVPELFSYYPWKRKSSEWKSLNRSGPSTDHASGAGLFRRGSSWNRETNRPGSATSDDHVQRRGTNGWAKSPKES